jgi:hypothetical protein
MEREFLRAVKVQIVAQRPYRNATTTASHGISLRETAKFRMRRRAWAHSRADVAIRDARNLPLRQGSQHA